MPLTTLKEPSNIAGYLVRCEAILARLLSIGRDQRSLPIVVIGQGWPSALTGIDWLGSPLSTLTTSRLMNL